MSPETDAEGVVSAAILSAVRRARLLALAESAAWGLAAAAIWPAAGALVVAAAMVWRWRTTSRASIVRALEHTHPDSRNLFVTADELGRGTLSAKPPVRSRVFADAAVRARRLDLRTAFPIARVVRVAVLAGLAWATIQTAHRWQNASSTGAGVLSRSTSPAAVADRTSLHVRVTIQPPAYTGLGESRTVDPQQLETIEGSAIDLSIDSSASSVRVEHEGRTLSLAKSADGGFSGRLRVTRTGYVVVIAEDGARRMMPLVVSPDALPAVRLTAPGRDLVYAGGNPRINFDARATDDFGLTSLALRYTKVTGSGENFEFQEGEIPLAVSPAGARDWTGRASRSLADLNLKDGDMLVYRAVATDARPGYGSASSDAFIIEISKLGAAAGDAFTLPQEETKYALSQQMLIVKTDRLHQRRAALPPDEFTEQALNLAVEQRMIRAEFVFMLGGEVDDEEVEAEQSVELQAGRLQNRGQRDLRAATVAMSRAGTLLTAANTADALVAERAAVSALQRAFARDRYILRALATRSQLDSSRRLTGNQADAAGWRRIPPDAPANRRAALLQDLLRGIGELMVVRLKPDTTSAQVASGFSRTRALVLAEEAIRIDPTAAFLRQAANELQRAAETTDEGVRARAVDAAAAAAVSEARRAFADAAHAAPPVAPAIAGAFADAMTTARLKPRATTSGERR